MSYGIGLWGTGGWSGESFIVTDQIPTDGAINVARQPTIAFLLSSDTYTVDLSTINLTVNGVNYITNGVFTIDATGIINSTDPNNVQITATPIQSFASLALVTIIVSAQNINSESPTNGTTWSFTVSAAVRQFITYVARGFDRIARLD